MIHWCQNCLYFLLSWLNINLITYDQIHTRSFVSKQPHSIKQQENDSNFCLPFLHFLHNQTCVSYISNIWNKTLNDYYTIIGCRRTLNNGRRTFFKRKSFQIMVNWTPSLGFTSCRLVYVVFFVSLYWHRESSWYKKDNFLLTYFTFCTKERGIKCSFFFVVWPMNFLQ